MVEFTRDELEIYFSEEELQRRVKELAEEIHRDFDGKKLHIVAVLNGSFVFLADLVRHIPTDDLSIDFLGISSYGLSSTTSGVMKLTKDLSLSIEGKDVLIVEDIIDTGLTMKYLINNLNTRNPRSIRVCTLLHKKEREIEKVPLDYVGFVVPDKFVVGYGLDYAEKFRNLPYIGAYTGDL